MKSYEDFQEAERALKIKQIEALEAETEGYDLYPHLYMHKHYKWSWDFENNLEDRVQIVLAPNQVGKTSTCIKKLIRIATEAKCWKRMWPELPDGIMPSQWWYLYPTNDVALVEFDEKWRPLLPRGFENSDDPIYGWRIEKVKEKLHALRFNSGITIYFKFYSQSATALQSGSCYLIALDEECPIELLPELQMRVKATKGYMFFVFTATLGQKFWADVIHDRVKWRHAAIYNPTLYDCKYYVDGTPSQWTDDEIKKAIDDCISQEEVDRRILARVVGKGQKGRQYPTFERGTHCVLYRGVPVGWTIVAGVDYGSGGLTNHPSAIAFIAFNPERTKGKIVRFWRGDGIITTAEDVVDKYEEMAVGLDIQTAFYDYSARDVGTVATRRGLPFERADKKRDSGKSILNSLFKNNALELCEWNEEHCGDIDPSHMNHNALAEELERLQENTSKTQAKDDGCDATRYGAIGVNWDFEKMSIARRGTDNLPKEEVGYDERAEAVRMLKENMVSDEFGINEEIEYWQGLMG